jgi:hypothetical protein
VITRGAHAIITDFTPGTDSLQFEGVSGLSLKHLHVRGNHDGDTVLHVADDQVVLLGVLPSQLHAYEGIA